MMIIGKNRSDQDSFRSSTLIRAEELDGIELDGGSDDFGDELLLRGAVHRSKSIDHRY